MKEKLKNNISESQYNGSLVKGKISILNREFDHQRKDNFNFL